MYERMSNAILAEKYQKLIAEITETDEEISEINRYLKSAESKLTQIVNQRTNLVQNASYVLKLIETPSMNNNLPDLT